MSRARRYANLFAVQFRMSLLQAMQYRVGFWTDGVLGLLWAMLGFVPLFTALQHRSAVAGWGPWELVVLTGCFTCMQGVFGALLQPALLASMDHIRRGSLDYLLLRPADALFLCLSATFSPWRLIEVLGGIGLIAAGLFGLQQVPTLLQLGGIVVMALLATVVLYALGIMILCASFKAMQLQNLTYFMEALLDFSRWPISVFRGPLRALFTFLVPLAVLTSYPAEAILRSPTAAHLLTSAAVALTLSLLARALWLRSLKNYSSASS